MSNKKALSIIIPTYNERENIPILLKRIDDSLRRHNIDYEVIIVDDNSPDGTADVALKLSSQYPIKVLKRKGKMGLSSAVLDGLKLANSDIIAVMDADLQHPPEVLPRMYEELISNSNDIVIASRYVKGGSIKQWSLIRRIISRTAIMIAHILIPKTRGLKDIMSGYFMFRRNIIEGVKLNPKGFKILLEILAKGNYSNVSEVPYTFDIRRYGKSKLGTKEIINYIIHVLNLSPYFIRFAIVGGTGAIVNLSALALLRYIAHLGHEISAALAI
ncbi:MAG: glycosyltransferase family 2 protein, partial [Thermoprotei archaeon]